MSLVLGLDLETTGLNFKEDYILEVGVALYDTEIRRVVEYFNEIILWPSRPLISKEIEDITGLNNKIVEKYGRPHTEVLSKVNSLSQYAEYIVGHNILDFDRRMYESTLQRVNDQLFLKNFYSWKYIDTMTDLPIPNHIKIRALKYLAYEHGYHLNNAHQALSDTLASIHLFSQYDFELLKQIVATPLVEIEAKVSYFDRDLAKNCGFKWDAQNKKWTMKIRKFWLDDKLKQMTFPFEILPETSQESTYDSKQGPAPSHVLQS